jgi:hypothetical protein
VRRSRTRRRRERQLALHPLLPLPTPSPSPLSPSSPFRTFTDVYTSARGHRGEYRLPPLFCGWPSLRAEGERRARHRAAAHAAGDADLRARLGSYLLQVPPPSPTRAQHCSSFCFLARPSRSNSTNDVFAVAAGLATVSTRSAPVPAHGHAHPCTPAIAQARSPGGVLAEPWAFCSCQTSPECCGATAS